LPASCSTQPPSSTSYGHTLQQVAVREAVTSAEALVPVFVRMEYLRGVILNLIEMWCLIREPVTVQDAFIDWSQKMRQERKACPTAGFVTSARPSVSGCAEGRLT
jgi:hypothetical protein